MPCRDSEGTRGRLESAELEVLQEGVGSQADTWPDAAKASSAQGRSVHESREASHRMVMATLVWH